MIENLQDADICECKRSRKIVHCPECGSRDLAGYRQRLQVAQGDGTYLPMKQYRCKRCGELFTDNDWKLRCRAPVPRFGRPKNPRNITIQVNPSNPLDIIESIHAIQKLQQK